MTSGSRCVALVLALAVLAEAGGGPAAAATPPEGGAVFDGETNGVRLEDGEPFNLMPFTLSMWLWLQDGSPAKSLPLMPLFG